MCPLYRWQKCTVILNVSKTILVHFVHCALFIIYTVTLLYFCLVWMRNIATCIKIAPARRRDAEVGWFHGCKRYAGIERSWEWSPPRASFSLLWGRSPRVVDALRTRYSSGWRHGSIRRREHQQHQHSTSMTRVDTDCLAYRTHASRFRSKLVPL